MNTEHPKIFISYAWSRQKTQDDVLELATRLMQDGVDVVLDKWSLKEGQDKYAFMERCVTDESITQVLIICDQAYKERADRREGGVGDETIVISPEIYGHMQQTKFIPLIFERDENSVPYIPAYIQAKKYIDFSNEDNYESSYEELVRALYDMPLYKKPRLGQKPNWLTNEEINLTELTLLTKSLKRGSIDKLSKYQSTCTKFIDNLIVILNNGRFKNDKFDAEELVQKISSIKPTRDAYFDFLETILASEFFSTDFVTNFFEKIYNEVGNTESGSFSSTIFEYYDFFRWESFIGTIAILKHYEKYTEIYHILNHTYFLKDAPIINYRVIPSKFSNFRNYFSMLEEIYQKNHNSRYLSYSAQLLTEREKLPILSKQALAETDLLLYQLSSIFISIENPHIHNQKWFPYMYPYVKRTDLWIKLQSKKFCEKILPLFGVTNINALKECISRATYDSDIHLRGAWNGAPNILSYISLEQIATLE